MCNERTCTRTSRVVHAFNLNEIPHPGKAKKVVVDADVGATDSFCNGNFNATPSALSLLPQGLDNNVADAISHRISDLECCLTNVMTLLDCN